MNFPKDAARLGTGQGSSVFIWHGLTYRFAQGRKGGTIYRARPCCRGIIYNGYMRRERRRLGR